MTLTQAGSPCQGQLLRVRINAGLCTETNCDCARQPISKLQMFSISSRAGAVFVCRDDRDNYTWSTQWTQSNPRIFLSQFFAICSGSVKFLHLLVQFWSLEIDWRKVATGLEPASF